MNDLSTSHAPGNLVPKIIKRPHRIQLRTNKQKRIDTIIVQIVLFFLIKMRNKKLIINFFHRQVLKYIFIYFFFFSSLYNTDFGKFQL